MKVKELIKKLQELPEEININFCSYEKSFDAEVVWDITKEEYEEGYEDEPYIYLT